MRKKFVLQKDEKEIKLRGHYMWSWIWIQFCVSFFFLHYKVNITETSLLVAPLNDVTLIVPTLTKKCESLETDFSLIGIRSSFEALWHTNTSKKRNDNWLITGYFPVQFIYQLRVPLFLPCLFKPYVKGLQKLKKTVLIFLIRVPLY